MGVSTEANPGRVNVTAVELLPSGVFEHAVERRLDVERKRIDRCYNRTRALFAEALVGELARAREPRADADSRAQPNSPDAVASAEALSSTWVHV
jgi:hypothetical protein